MSYERSEKIDNREKLLDVVSNVNHRVSEGNSKAAIICVFTLLERLGIRAATFEYSTGPVWLCIAEFRIKYDVKGGQGKKR